MHQSPRGFRLRTRAAQASSQLTPYTLDSFPLSPHTMRALFEYDRMQYAHCASHFPPSTILHPAPGTRSRTVYTSGLPPYHLTSCNSLMCDVPAIFDTQNIVLCRKGCSVCDSQPCDATGLAFLRVLTVRFPGHRVPCVMLSESQSDPDIQFPRSLLFCFLRYRWAGGSHSNTLPTL